MLICTCEKRELLIVRTQRQMASESNGLLMAEAAPSDTPPRLVGDNGAQQKREFKLRCKRKVKSNLATIVHIRKVLSRDRSRHLGKACVLILPSLPSILPSKLGGLLHAAWLLRESACPFSWDLLPISLFFAVHRMTRGFGVFVRTSLSGSPPCLREIEAANHPLMMEKGKRE